jgi:hypothetical protein
MELEDGNGPERKQQRRSGLLLGDEVWREGRAGTSEARSDQVQAAALMARGAWESRRFSVARLPKHQHVPFPRPGGTLAKSGLDRTPREAITGFASTVSWPDQNASLVSWANSVAKSFEGLALSYVADLCQDMNGVLREFEEAGPVTSARSLGVVRPILQALRGRISDWSDRLTPGEVEEFLKAVEAIGRSRTALGEQASKVLQDLKAFGLSFLEARSAVLAYSTALAAMTSVDWSWSAEQFVQDWRAERGAGKQARVSPSVAPLATAG